MRKNKNWKKEKNQDSIDKQTPFLAPHPLAFGVVFAMWLHIGASQNIQEEWIYNPFSTTKIHHGFMRSWNLTCLVLPVSSWNVLLTSS
jgi:hypothetical protein